MFPISRFRALFFGLLLTIIGVTGFWQGQPVQAQKPAPVKKYKMPSFGTVRIVAQKVRSDAGQVEWRWTIVSDRHWNGLKTDSHGNIELTGGNLSLPATSPNIYVHNVQVRVGKGADGKPRLFTRTISRQYPISYRNRSMAVRMRGKEAQGTEEEVLTKTVAANRACQVRFTGDKTLSLPVKIPLFERTFGLDGTGKVTRRVVYLTISNQNVEGIRAPR